MDKLKELYKPGPKYNATLSARVRDNKKRRQTARSDKFAAGRKIPVEDSPGTPVRQTAQAVAKIVDRNQKLKAYRVLRNTQKLKEIQEQKSPFLLAVPVGRWVEKKERAPPFRFQLNDTPVRKALANERVLKKSTVKNLIAQSTAKKENVMIFGKNLPKPVAVKSKKKILGELNAVQNVVQESEEQNLESPLNSTFEILPDIEENIKENKPTSRLRRSNSMPDIAPKSKPIPRKILTPPAKAAHKKKAVQPTKPAVKAMILKPIVTRKAVKVPPKPVNVKRQEVDKQKLRATSKRNEIVLHEKSDEIKAESPIAEKEAPKAERKKQPARSSTYNVYKSSLDIQISYLKMQIGEIISNKDFLENLSEDQQTFVHQTVQQCNLIISDKLGKFQEFLEKFEADLSRPDDPKAVTEEDVENYWFLVYDEIEKLKSDISKTQDLKNGALALGASQKKRRTRKTYLPEDGTPRRSRRVAEIAGTPKHNPSCYGCVTLSATKANTPKSVNKRRTAFKKSVVFENVEQTPKRSESRRSTKRFVGTPKRSLIRMNAVEDDLEDNDLELAEIL